MAAAQGMWQTPSKLPNIRVAAEINPDNKPMASRNILRELRSVNCMKIMASTTSRRTFLDDETDKENTMSILIATDNHIGYLEKDPERGEDSFTTFEEILELAKENQVDFILLGGDLFHENKPSRKVVHKTMELLRKYCMGDSPCYLEFLSDQSINFASSSFPTVNYEDPNYNISTPVFSIHGNHDDPAGDGNLCTLNLFSVNGLVNYFGKASNVDDITVNPILIQKGSTKLALYGLGSIRDERLHRTFINKKVKMLRPKEDADSWFNCFVLHQNRTKHGPKNYIPEQFLDEFLDLVIWGHEHECLIDPQWTDSEKDFYISQPGSSVATSLCAAEAKPKHVGILKIQEKQFRMDKILLKTVRPFYTKDVILSETDVDPTDDEAIQEYLTEQVEELIQKSNLEHTGHRKQPKQPIIRIRVEYSGGFSPFNVNRFGQRFVKRVANTKDILLFFRKKVFEKKGGRGTGDGGTARIHPEILDDTSMEDLIMGYLNSEDENQKLRLLSGHKMGLALQEFVDKSETEAIGEIVKLQLRDTQNKMKKRDTVKEGNIIEEIIKETERSRTEDLTQEERVRTREVLQEAVNESRNKKPEEESVVIDGSDEESENQIGQTSRGRGKGRGRGRGRGKGTRTTTKTRDTSWITTTSRPSSRSKQNASIVIEDDFAAVETFNGKNSSQSARNQSSTMSRSKRYDNSEMDEEEDPFAFPSKRQRK